MKSNYFETIPKHWKLTKFGDVAKITCGVAATPEYVDSSVGIPFLSARNVQNERLSLNFFQYIPLELHRKLTKNTKPEKGDVLLTRVGAGIGEAALIDIDFEFSVYVSLTLIKCKKELHSNFAKLLLNTNYYRYLATRDQFAGGGVQNLNVQMVKEYPIPTPPIPEQKKIAQILSTWDKAIDTSEKLLANSRQQKKALMQQLLTGKKRLRDKNGVRFSGEWKLKKLSEICDLNPRKADEPSDGLVSFIAMDSVSEDAKIKRQEERKYIDVSKGFTSFIDHDVIVAKITPCFENGKGAYAEGLKNSVGFGSTEFHILRAKQGISSKYIYYITNTSEFRIRGEANMQGSAGQKRVTTDYLKGLKLSLPSSPEEQQKIAATLSSADREIETLQQKLDCLKQEKKALMQQLLTGKRRVQVEEAQ
ncbi:restriction endonuclease subunit S [Microbulbifer echini]|uniref:Restriction endonuclease subunit S n=1 Tax=Microbulbifer echini TaxID=1529067 RepID=A0ABV4NML4_9GAMM